MKKFYFVIIVIILFCINPIWAQKKRPVRKKSGSRNPIEINYANEMAFIIDGKQISISQILNDILKNSYESQIATYDVAMADSNYLKFQKKYSTYLNAEAGMKKSEYPDDMSYAGTRKKTWDTSLGLSRAFSSGTTLMGGVMNEYAKTDDLNPQAGDPEYYRPVMYLKLQHEFLKNSFGYSDRRQEEIFKNMDKMQHEAVTYQLSALLVNVIVDYWQYAIHDSKYKNSLLKLRETRRVRNIIGQNVRLGLNERFDLNYWNSLVAGSEAENAQTLKTMKEIKRKLLRNMNIPEKAKFDGVTILKAVKPEYNFEQSLKDAYTQRVDYKNALLELENSKLQLEIYANESLPSLTGEVGVNYMGQRDKFSDAVNDTTGLESPTYEARVKLSYPFDDSEQMTNERDARYKLEQAKLNLKKIKREVRDDILDKIENIETNFEVYSKMKNARIQSETYYYRLRRYLSRGRFTAATVKTALDAMVDSRQRELEALVGFNIALLSFDLAKNELFKKYGIDIKKHIDSKKERLK